MERKSIQFTYTENLSIKNAFRILIKRGFNEMKRLYPEHMETMINEIKKDLYRTKAVARLMYYEPANGDLIYKVEVFGKERTFPIHTIQRFTASHQLTKDNSIVVDLHFDSYKLTEDLRGARFEPEIKASSLIRWIEQAIDNDEFH